jgi:hypothetical protein
MVDVDHVCGDVNDPCDEQCLKKQAKRTCIREGVSCIFRAQHNGDCVFNNCFYKRNKKTSMTTASLTQSDNEQINGISHLIAEIKEKSKEPEFFNKLLIQIGLFLEENDKLVEENDKLVEENDKLVEENDKLVEENEILFEENEKLKKINSAAEEESFRRIGGVLSELMTCKKRLEALSIVNNLCKKTQ